jgi:hypothetical protein
MGLSFHYKGSFNTKASLSELIDEVTDVAVTNNWTYHIFEKEFSPKELGKKKFNDKMYGIVFSPPKCEPVFISFLSNGIIAGTTYLQFYDTLKKYGPSVSVKTQYAGPEAHMLVINLLKYLAPKYFVNFELYDEGEYWETGSEEKLRACFQRLSFLLDSFATALENTTRKKGESVEDAIKRVASDLHLKEKKGKRKK